MNAPNKLLTRTSSSISPGIRRFGQPYALVNPGTGAENVVAIVEHVIEAPVPAGYRSIDDVVRDSEADTRRADALRRARIRLGVKVGSKAATLASLRLVAGLSQARVAQLLGNSQSSYSLIESGRRTDILLSTFEKLVEILGVSRDELATALANTGKKVL